MGAGKVQEGHVARARSASVRELSPIIFVEYERRRYFNWFVVEMEEDSHVGSLARWQSSASRFAPPVSEVDLICRISHGRSAYRTNTKKPGGESVSRLGRKAEQSNAL